MKLPSYSIIHRLRVIKIFLFTACCIIAITLLRFQLFEGELFVRHSKRNCLRHEKVTSLRGAILDRHGALLATNRPVTELAWHGSGNNKLSQAQLHLIDFIKQTTHEELPSLETISHCERLGIDCIFINDLPFEQLCPILERAELSQNIIIKIKSARFYPQASSACHIVGYFRPSSIQKTGTFGLERLFEEQLRGIPGEREMIVNSVGRNLLTREIRRAEDGEPLRTTLDLSLQKMGESLFTQGQAGALIVMDPFTGDLLSVVSKPSFDPNMFTGLISAELWKTCIEQKPFINRAFSSCYPPASVFKIITAAAGLEKGIIQPNFSCFCSGEITFGGRPFRCSSYKTGGHGMITSIEEAIAKSCNIPFFEIGKHISIDTLAEFAAKFGLGKPTGIIFPERAGLIPTSAWKKKVYKENWHQGETLMAAIGQTYCLATPLQMVRVIGAICTGFLVRPRILLSESIDRNILDISTKTRLLLKQAIRKTIKTGTAISLSKLANMEIYGKTGTAQTSHRSKLELGKQYLPHGWFVCYAQYKNTQPILIAIFLENAGSSSVAIQYAKQFLLYYSAYLDKQTIATNDDSEIEDNELGEPQDEEHPESHPTITSKQ